MVTSYTSSSIYQAPLKPRITIFDRLDSGITSPYYVYDPFTDVGNVNKPLSLSFGSDTTNSGMFSLEIEDSTNTLDMYNITKGNRVMIECSKDGTNWTKAFKGLIRSFDQNIYGVNGRSVVLNGYSYLIRLTERITQGVLTAALLPDGVTYDRTDSTMFINNLLYYMLTQNYFYSYQSADDTDAANFFKVDNIPSSPIDNFVPRINADLEPLSQLIQSVLEFSQGAIVTMNPADDQLNLFSPELVTAATGKFLITDVLNQNSDDADKTMYPLAPYKYSVSYDYPDSGSRFIASIGNISCPETTFSGADVTFFDTNTVCWDSVNGNVGFGAIVSNRDSPITEVSVGSVSVGAPSGTGIEKFACKFIELYQNFSNGDEWVYETDFGPGFDLHVDGVIGKPRPTAAPGVATAHYVMKTDPTWAGQSLITFPNYKAYPNEPMYLGLKVFPSSLAVQNSTNFVGIGMQFPYNSTYWKWKVSTGALIGSGSLSGAFNSFIGGELFRSNIQSGGGVTTIPPCGGLASSADADAIFALGNDMNIVNRLGVVERVLSDIPSHVKTIQSMNEYLFSKLYIGTKGRFTYDFPSVSMPNKMPQAGDMIAHVDTRNKVGTSSTPVQVGVIMSVKYDFAQDSDQVLGLRKLSVQTTGLRKGYY